MMSRTCQACRNTPVEVIEKEDDPDEPYELCRDCHHRLRTFSLRPREWYNLASVHGCGKFILHDDLYLEDGTALQPQEEVVDADLFPAPTLEEVSGSCDELVGYSLTRWHLTPDLVSAFRRQPPEALLETFSKRLRSTSNEDIISEVLCVCGEAVGPPAASFVRQNWDRYVEVTFRSLALAAVRCLPFEEGFAKVTAVLTRLPANKRRQEMRVLTWFESPRTLDWIEANIAGPIVADWGRLAACSNIDWPRIAKWLEHGRPLSLVALDALDACVRYTSDLLKERKPKLHDPPEPDLIVEALEEYRLRDKVPRVEKIVPLLVGRAEELARGG